MIFNGGGHQPLKILYLLIGLAKAYYPDGTTFKEWTADMVNGLSYYHNLNNDGDVNNYKTTGVYTIANPTNTPVTNWGTLICDMNVGTPYQIYIPDGANMPIWKRRYNKTDDTFGTWDCENQVYVGSSAPTYNNALIWIQT